MGTRKWTQGRRDVTAKGRRDDGGEDTDADGLQGLAQVTFGPDKATR